MYIQSKCYRSVYDQGKERKGKHVTPSRATRLKNISQRRARFHFSDDRSFVYITISAVELGVRAGKKKRISIFPWHSTSTSGGIHYHRRRCYVREPSLFLSGRIAMRNKSDVSLNRLDCFSHFFYFPSHSVNDGVIGSAVMS